MTLAIRKKLTSSSPDESKMVSKDNLKPSIKRKLQRKESS